MAIEIGAHERQQDILRAALRRRAVRVKELAAEYGVHEMTIRRDLDLLAESGQIERIHGGARLTERSSEELAHDLRATVNGPAKIAIARAALGLVQDGDTIALDASTTSLALARALAGRPVQAIVTSLEGAEALAAGGVPFVLAGGTYHPPSRSFVGPLVRVTLERLNPDKVFFSAKAFSPETGFADPHVPEVEVKETLIRSGGTIIALMDASKFGGRALARIVALGEIDALVTEIEPAAPVREAIEASDVRLVIADSVER